MSTILEWLASWYANQCNGEWEENYGVKIYTLGNPGWSVHIDLSGTSLVDATFEDVVIERTENDWLQCRVQKSIFEGYGGPQNLQEILEIFQAWVNSLH
jgi:hypothetical protein